MIAIGADHRGYKLKEELKKYLNENGIEFNDIGAYSDERTDFPIQASSVCKEIQEGRSDKGIILCGSGIGMAMVANKYKGIRCAMCHTEDAAKEAKAHHNANVLALPADILNVSEAVKIIRAWIATDFLGGRYSDRLKMIEDIEKNNMK